MDIRNSITIPETINNLGPNSWVNDTIIKPMIYRITVKPFGTWNVFILSPKIPIRAGSKVIPAKTATNTTTTAPTPNAWKVFSGIINIPKRAKTTVNPLNITALPAVLPVVTIAFILSNPLNLSSLYLDSINKQ